MKEGKWPIILVLTLVSLILISSGVKSLIELNNPDPRPYVFAIHPGDDSGYESFELISNFRLNYDLSNNSGTIRALIVNEKIDSVLMRIPRFCNLSDQRIKAKTDSYSNSFTLELEAKQGWRQGRKSYLI